MMGTKLGSKKMVNLVKYIIFIIQNFTAILNFVLVIILFYIMSVFLKAKMIFVFEYLGLEAIWDIFTLTTIAFAIICLNKGYFPKIKPLKKINNYLLNNYLLFSIYLIAISIATVIIIMHSLIPNEVIFDEEIELKNRITNESFKIGNIKCTSESFAFVKGEMVPCSITAEIPESILADKPNTEFTEIVIRQRFVDTKMYRGQGEYNESSNSSQFMSYDYSLTGNKLSDMFIPLYLLEKDFIDLTFHIKTSSNAHFILVNRHIILVNRDIAVSKTQQTNNLIYTLLLFSMSFSVLAIFGGINSLRQIIENGKTAEKHKEKKTN